MTFLYPAVAFLVAFIGGTYLTKISDSYQQQEHERAKRERRESIPHVIREADGCKVYAFLAAERYHYFTRCPNERTTTDSSWEECRQSGKVRSCTTKTEQIEVTTK